MLILRESRRTPLTQVKGRARRAGGRAAADPIRRSVAVRSPWPRALTPAGLMQVNCRRQLKATISAGFLRAPRTDPLPRSPVDEYPCRYRCRRRPGRCGQEEPLAGAPRLDAERDRSRAGPLHVGPHVLRLVDPDQQGRDVDDHPDVRGLLHLRQAVPDHRLVRRRHGDRALRRARAARRAQVPDQLPAVQAVPRPPEADRPRRHDAVDLAGLHRLRAVLPRVGAPVPDADAAAPDRPVRVRRPHLDRDAVAAVHPAAARRRAARRHRPVPAGGEVGLVHRRRRRCHAAAAEDARSGR